MILTSGIQIRDPFVFICGGRCYLYGSTDKDIWESPGVGFDVYKGTDLEHWDGPYPAFRPPEGYWGQKNFWAPEVYAHGGAYYMFASFIGEGYNRGTAVLRADAPEGPFMPWSAGAVTPREWMCLDGTLHIGRDGGPWIVFCHEWVQTGDGTICASRLSADLSRTVSEPVTLFRSSDAQWSKPVTTPGGHTGYVTDGCFLHRTEDGRLLMLWSCFGAEGYQLGVAESLSGEVPGPWRQAERPLFAKNGGHGMVFRALDGRLMLALHTPNETPFERALFLEIAETSGGLALV